jgi:putative membrane protein
VILPLLALVAYLGAAVAERGRRGWSPWSTGSFAAGCLVAAWALSPAFDGYADSRFEGHMAQHLLLAMVAPLALVLGAPVTLALRSLPHRAGLALGRVLASRVLGVLTNPWVALVPSAGGLVVLYFTPLYAASTTDETLHRLVHLHLLASGCLFAWAVAGPDPSPHRASVRTRLVVLGVSIAVHSSVAQLVYAGILVRVREPVVEMQSAGSLMYFGGDIAELLLALALLVTWRPVPRSASRSVSRAVSEGPA